MADSKIDELASKTYPYDSREYSYHLGTVQRDGRPFTIARAKFLRSSAKGSEYPPARGHASLIIFDDAFRAVSYGRPVIPGLFMDGKRPENRRHHRGGLSGHRSSHSLSRVDTRLNLPALSLCRQYLREGMGVGHVSELAMFLIRGRYHFGMKRNF